MCGNEIMYATARRKCFEKYVRIVFLKQAMRIITPLHFERACFLHLLLSFIKVKKIQKEGLERKD